MARAISITLDKPRNLRFDVNAISDFEDKTGKSVTSLGDETSGLSIMRSLLWAGLKHEDRGLTLERVGNIMGVYFDNGGTIEDLSGIIVKALRQSEVLRGSDDGDEGNVTTEAQS